MAKKLTPQLIGMVARIVGKISNEDKVSTEDAFEIYAGDLSRNMKKYDVRAEKKEILDLSSKRISTVTPKKPRKKKATKKKPKRRSKTNLITLPDGRKGRLIDPEMIKVKGTAKLTKTDKGTIIEATRKTKKLYVKCSPEAEGVKLDEKSAGCFVQDASYKDLE